MPFIKLAESGLLPDYAVRLGIRRLLSHRLRSLSCRDNTCPEDAVAAFADRLRHSPLAIATDAANDQHYEVPVEFFENVLGPQLKYSSGFFAGPQSSLADAEIQMLGHTCTRAELEDGMRVLELGCGWGSLTLWIAHKYPNCKVVAVSNSSRQREFIEERAYKRKLSNISVITADMRDFQTAQTFDRVFSIEMFEHMRNYELLLRRVAGWMNTDAKAFVHIFCHRDTPYFFEAEGATNWMGRHFFTGGMMPSESLFSHFSDHLCIDRKWRINGMHYYRTCEEWLKNLDANRSAILARFCRDTPFRDAKRHLQRWRIFLMACAEIFRYGGGNEWYVTHYLFGKSVVHSPQQETMPSRSFQLR